LILVSHRRATRIAINLDTSTRSCFYVNGQRTHIQFSPMYRQLLGEIAGVEGCSMSAIVSKVDRERSDRQSLASAVREFILQWLLDHPMTLPRIGQGKSVGRSKKQR
jgi:predicted DNA-binding ribbon-helix-helix protein